MALLFRIKEELRTFRAFLIGRDPFFLQTYYRLHFRIRPGSMDEIFDRYARKRKDFYFIQAGGNDGFMNDPIFRFIKKYGWKGIITEPQKRVFERRLKRTYHNAPNVILENVAISGKDETQTLYKLGISNARWATGLASFRKDTLIRQIKINYVGRKAKKEGIRLPDNPEEYIVTEDIRCFTLETLMKRHGLPRLDLLQLDTEGYDFEIIRGIDFDRLVPRMISFETEHLDPKELEECEALLGKHNYRLHKFRRDAVAVHASMEDSE